MATSRNRGNASAQPARKLIIRPLASVSQALCVLARGADCSALQSARVPGSAAPCVEVHAHHAAG